MFIKIKEGILVFIFLFVAFFMVLCKNREPVKEEKSNTNDEPVRLDFKPDIAVEVPFESLFKSTEPINFQKTNESKIKMLFEVFRTDSFLIAGDLRNYLVFDLKGRFKNKVGSTGDGPNSNRSLGFYYANNESILSICGTKWIKYDMNGSVLGRGSIPYKIYPFSFIPLNDTTWLFYIPLIYKADTLRLWTTDQNFRIKKQYLSYNKDSRNGGAGFMKNIHKAGNEIYITDRVVDTIYRFTEKTVVPVYVFDFGHYTFKWQINQIPPKLNEVTCQFTIVSRNTVLRKVTMNGNSYFVFHNRTTKTTKTIKKITNGPDLINSWILKGTDDDDKLYWELEMEKESLIDDSAIKFGYADLLKQRLKLGYEANPFLLVTTLK